MCDVGHLSEREDAGVVWQVGYSVCWELDGTTWWVVRRDNDYDGWYGVEGYGGDKSLAESAAKHLAGDIGAEFVGEVDSEEFDSEEFED